MPANEIRVDYGVLQDIAHRFRQRAEATEALTQQIRDRVHLLESGGWDGRGAKAFFREMHQEVIPASQRLILALNEANRVTLEIIRIMREAEEEAARPFGQFSDKGNSPVNSPGAESPGTILPSPMPPSAIFNKDYMERMVGLDIQGADSAALRNGMLTLLDPNASQKDIDQALHQIAQARGMDIEQVRAHYQRYLEIKEQIAQSARMNGKKPPWEDSLREDFVGSTPNLRFGKVVGDALGLDPAFAALLNPTGGMVGPGSWQLYPAIPEDPLTYHGIFHDAGGFLYNYLGMGPGYDYLGQESHRNPGSPLTGQESGIHYWNAYWRQRFGDQSFVDEITDTVGTGIGYMYDKSTHFLKQVSNTMNTAKRIGHALFRFINKS